MVDMRGKLTAALRVRIPPPKEAGATAAVSPPKPAQSRNVDDPELVDEPRKSLGEELDDEIQF